MDEKKRFRQFLYERGLSSSFRTYQRIKPNRQKRIITTNVTKFGLGLTQQKIYVIREGNYTVFRDYYTLERLAKSRRTLTKAIYSLFSKPTIVSKQITVDENQRTQFEHGVSSIDKYIYEKPKRSITLKYKEKSYSYFPEDKKLRTRYTTNIQPKKSISGIVVVDVEFIKGKSRHRGQYQSKGGYILSNKQEVKDAIVSAVHNGLKGSHVNFSPEQIILHDYWFVWHHDKKYMEHPTPRQRLPRGARQFIRR